MIKHVSFIDDENEMVYKNPHTIEFITRGGTRLGPQATQVGVHHQVLGDVKDFVAFIEQATGSLRLSAIYNWEEYKKVLMNQKGEG